MLLLSKEDIKSVITMKDMIEADKQAFKMVVDGTVDTPLRTVINGKYDGAFLFMPAYAPELDAAAMKVINIFPHNIDNNLMTSPAQTMLIDGKTGYVIAMLDGTYVTQLRTGASSGAAFDLLGKKECKKGAMIGTGGQAAAQLEAMLAARKLEEVKIFDLNEERCKAFAEEMQKGLAKYGAKIIPAKDSDDCIEDADLIITVTPSAKPVFDGTGPNARPNRASNVEKRRSLRSDARARSSDARPRSASYRPCRSSSGSEETEMRKTTSTCFRPQGMGEAANPTHTNVRSDAATIG